MDESFARMVKAFEVGPARRMLQDFCTPQALRAFDRFASIEQARKLLAEGLDPHLIAYRLVVAHGFSVKTAQRRMRLAGWDGKC